MGFDLYICDENGDDSRAQGACDKVADAIEAHGGVDAFKQAVREHDPEFLPDSPLLFQQYVFDNYRQTGLYFRASRPTWGALVAEMETQGMIAPDAIPGEKVIYNEGDHVTTPEIEAALARSKAKPTAPPDHETNREFDDLMASMPTPGVEFESPARTALTQMSMEQWGRTWTELLGFLERARESGGFRVW